MTDRELAEAVEVIPGRLYWVALHTMPRANASIHYFCIDQELVYQPFFADFGPLNMGLTYRYCKMLEKKLSDPALANKRIVHYCSQDPHKRANAAYLISAFQLIVLKKTADEAYRPFVGIYPPFLPYRDATYGICTYHCTIIDCLKGVEYATKLGWFDYNTFDIATYEYYERVENGDLNWIIPKKFVAFSGPSSTTMDPEGFRTFTPEDYVPIWKKLGVSLVVRLNKKQYEKRRFTDHGIKHTDLYFLDGSCPSREIIGKFLDLVESEPSAVAVHCKAGLGRTGSLIGCYAMKNYRFPAAAWIGWNRVCRPGSVLGPQQHFLNEIQNEMMAMGAAQGKIRPALTDAAEEQVAHRIANMSIDERNILERGDHGQGERLVAAKYTKTGQTITHGVTGVGMTGITGVGQIRTLPLGIAGTSVQKTPPPVLSSLARRH